MEVIEEHMKNEADLIAAAGGDTDPNSMTMSIASDWTYFERCYPQKQILFNISIILGATKNELI